MRLSEEALRQHLGAVIRERRKSLGLTLAEMARRTNVSLGYLSQIELGKNSASIETLYRIALGLQMRVADLFQGFCSCFNDADAVIVADIYPAGEAPIEGISRDALVEGLHRAGHRHVRALDGPADLAGIVAEEAHAGDFVICLGAGDITAWAQALPDALKGLAAA